MRRRMTDSIALSASAATLRRAAPPRGAAGSRNSSTVEPTRIRSPGRAAADLTGRSLRNVPLADSRSVTTHRAAVQRQRAVAARDRLIVDVDLALHHASDGHRHAIGERVHQRGAPHRNLSSRRHGYRIPVSCAHRRRGIRLCRSCVFSSSSFISSGRAPRAQSPRGSTPIATPAAASSAKRMSSPFAWERLALLGDTFGHRLERLGGARERDQVGGRRDEEGRARERPRRAGQSAALGARPREPRDRRHRIRSALVMLGLGNSVGTPADGVEAEVLVVRSFDELDAAGVERAAARSCSSTCPSRPTAKPCSIAARDRRGRRRSAPSPRSSAPSVLPGLRTPHTGALSYTDGDARRFPAPPSPPRMPSACSGCRTAAPRSASA